MNEIDEILEVDGYHLTRAVSPIGLTWQPAFATSKPLVAGRPGSVTLSLENGNSTPLHNLGVTISGDSAPDQVSGSGWITEKHADGSWRCRRGGLDAGETGRLSVVWNSFPASVELTCSAGADALPAVSVTSSFSSGSGDEPPSSSLLDSDGDGTSDELELALGGDPSVASQQNLAGGSLLPVWSRLSAGFEYRFSRRQPSFESGRFYLIESSSDLLAWSSNLPTGTELSARAFDPPWPGFEQVRVRLPETTGPRFYRMRYQFMD